MGDRIAHSVSIGTFAHVSSVFKTILGKDLVAVISPAKITAYDAFCRTWRILIDAVLGRSAVRGEMRAESDVDIVVEFEPGVRVGLIKFESLAGSWRRSPGAESTSLPAAN